MCIKKNLFVIFTTTIIFISCFMVGVNYGANIWTTFYQEQVAD